MTGHATVMGKMRSASENTMERDHLRVMTFKL
jgi:hypothetical protein